ncbi:MAG TPA: DUF72 domain-containing protein [bacterium]|nr:DUF72 domain-containing protein [bacterium]
MSDDQHTLFAEPDPMEPERARWKPLAERVPPGVRMGTSTWSFPGWKGFVWGKKRSEAELAREGLREYARHPLLTTVGLDRGYYAPIPAADLERYASQVPEGFPFCTKAPESIVTPVFLPHGRSGGTPGAPNPDFLSAEKFMREVGEVFARNFAAHTGPFLFEFPPLPPAQKLSSREFCERLDDFFAALPASVPKAVELRDRELFTPRYRKVLAKHGASHVYSWWSWMPGIRAQHDAIPPGDAPFTVARLSLKPGTRYEDRLEQFLPFDKLVEPDEGLRADVVALTRDALSRNARVFILVNNKAEGSSPLTIFALAERLARAAT